MQIKGQFKWIWPSKWSFAKPVFLMAHCWFVCWIDSKLNSSSFFNYTELLRRAPQQFSDFYFFTPTQHCCEAFELQHLHRVKLYKIANCNSHSDPFWYKISHLTATQHQVTRCEPITDS